MWARRSKNNLAIGVMAALVAFVVIVALGLVGCSGDSGDAVQSRLAVSAPTNVTYLCVGMETSKRFGGCAGCALDSSRMDSFLRDNYGYEGTLLQSETATRAAVAKAISCGINSTPADGLFIFYYSGHGGREKLDWGTSEPEGGDEEDEYLCLYDSYLLDDEIWKLISNCRGRVFLIFDACHSQTMFRSIQCDISEDLGYAVPLDTHEVMSSGPRGFSLGIQAIPQDAGFRMLCWSGCMEKEYSYGSSSGGVMTSSMLALWKAGISYDELWSNTCRMVGRKQSTQHPTVTLYGEGFKEAFR